MKRDYIAEISKFKKSNIILFVFVVILSIFLTVVVMTCLSGNFTILLNNTISIVIGCFSTLIVEKIRYVQKEGRSFLYKIEDDNAILNDSIEEIGMLLDKIYFIASSHDNTFPIMNIYNHYQYLRKTLNDNLFDNISIIGLNSIFDEINDILLSLSDKKDLNKNIVKIQSLIEKVKNVINKQLKNNELDKQVFLNEEEKFDKLVGIKTKKKS